MRKPHVNIYKLREDAFVPFYGTGGSVAFDISAVETTIVLPGCVQMVHTGLAVEVPEGHEMQVRQRSGISIYRPNYITIGTGTIDQDYRGEIMVPVINNIDVNWKIARGLRIAQCIISPITKCEIRLIDKLSETARGTGGFGSTGE